MDIFNDSVKEAANIFIQSESINKKMILILQYLKIAGATFSSWLLFNYFFGEVIINPSIKNIIVNATDGTAILYSLLWIASYLVIYEISLLVLSSIFKVSIKDVPSSFFDKINQQKMKDFLYKKAKGISAKKDVVDDVINDFKFNVVIFEENVVRIIILILLLIIQVPQISILKKGIIVASFFLIIWALIPFVIKVFYSLIKIIQDENLYYEHSENS